MAANREGLQAMSDERIRALEATIQGFEEGLADIAARWRNQLVDLIVDSPSSARSAGKLANLVYVQRQVQAQLNRLGYDDLANELLASYGDSIERAEEVLRTLGIRPRRLSALDANALRTLRSNDYEWLMQIGSEAVAEVSRQVTQNAIAGRPRSEMVNSIEVALESKFKSYALTYADTALVSYDRRAEMAVWSRAGVKYFLYRGPKDIKNREVCARWVGKVFSLAEIEELDNGARQPKPVLYFGGGWNCRHVWTPALPSQRKESEENPEEESSGATL